MTLGVSPSRVVAAEGNCGKLMTLSNALVPQDQPQLLCCAQQRVCRQACSLQCACGRGWCWWQRGRKGYSPLVLPLHLPLPLPPPIKFAANLHGTMLCGVEAVQVAVSNAAWVAEVGCVSIGLFSGPFVWEACGASNVALLWQWYGCERHALGFPRPGRRNQIRACASLEEKLEKKAN